MKIKQLLCNHKYLPLGNAYGDLANDLGGRTCIWCVKCGRKKFISEHVLAPIILNIAYPCIAGDVGVTDNAFRPNIEDMFIHKR